MGGKTTVILNWESFISKLPVKFISNQLNRRQLIKALFASSAVAGLTSTGAVNGALANAPKPYSFKGDDKAFLLLMAKDIYPHDGFLDDKPYQEVIDGILKDASTNAELKTLVLDGLTALEKDTHATHGKSYVSLKSYGAREAMLRRIEETPFFQKIRGGLLFGLYNNKKLFPKFGYEGSSWEEGGYIDRGFSDMTWLPQDPRVKGDKK